SRCTGCSRCTRCTGCSTCATCARCSGCSECTEFSNLQKQWELQGSLWRASCRALGYVRETSRRLDHLAIGKRTKGRTISIADRNVGVNGFHHKEFAQFLKYSRGSLYEVSDDLRD